MNDHYYDKDILYIVLCHPYSKFKNKPNDISRASLVKCPNCDGKMWFSIKKKEIIFEYKKRKLHYIFECHDCFEFRVKNNKESFENIMMEKI